MGRKSSLSLAQRVQIVTLHQEGYSERMISERTQVSKTAVHNAVVKFNTDGTFHDKKRCGRPRKTTRRDDNAMRRIAVRSPTKFMPKN